MSKGGVVENIVRPFYVGMHVVCLFVATSMFGLKYTVGVWVAGVLGGVVQYLSVAYQAR